ncbi:MAG: PmbA protein [Bradymonadia bacterium]|jgi:PmbA protein
MQVSERESALTALAADVVERAKAAGATASEVFVRQGSETSIQVRDGAVEELQGGQPKSVGIRLWRGGRVASTYATDMRPATIDTLIADTLQLADLTDEVPEAALVDKHRLASEVPELGLYDAMVGDVPAERKLEIARATEAAALAADERIVRTGGAAYSDHIMTSVLANSHGFRRAVSGTFVSYHVEAIADDADGKKRNGMWYTMGRALNGLLTPEEVGRVAAERATRQIGAGAVPTATLPVVFDPLAAAALLGLLFSVIKGGSVERGSSYLIGKLGESIAASGLTVYDDPLIIGGSGSRPTDGEGLAASRTEFVKDGVLQQWALNSYNARKLGLEPTGHASRPASGAPGESASNLRIATGAHSVDDLIKDISYGFYCESMMGFGFNAATGDFSRGASGRLIENGQLTRPVSEVTLSANFADLWPRLDGVGDSFDASRSVASPALRFSSMTLAGS